METITKDLRADVAAAEQLPALRQQLTEAKAQLEERREFKRKNRAFGQDGRDELQDNIELRIRTLNSTISGLEQRSDRAKSQLSRQEFLSAGRAEAEAALRLRPALRKTLAAAEKDKAESERVADAARAALSAIDERRAAAIAAAGRAAYTALTSGSAVPRDAKAPAIEAEGAAMQAALKFAEETHTSATAAVVTARDALAQNRAQFYSGRARQLIVDCEAAIAIMLPQAALAIAAARMAGISGHLMDFENMAPNEESVDAAAATLLAEYE